VVSVEAPPDVFDGHVSVMSAEIDIDIPGICVDFFSGVGFQDLGFDLEIPADHIFDLFHRDRIPLRRLALENFSGKIYVNLRPEELGFCFKASEGTLHLTNVTAQLSGQKVKDIFRKAQPLLGGLSLQDLDSCCEVRLVNRGNDS